MDNEEALNELFRLLPEDAVGRKLLSSFPEDYAPKVLGVACHPTVVGAYDDVGRAYSRAHRGVWLPSDSSTLADLKMPVSTMMEVGKACLPMFGVCGDDLLLAHALEFLFLLKKLSSGETLRDGDPADGVTLAQANLSMGRWAQKNFPSVKLTAKQACALALSDLAREQLAEIHPPWPSFMLHTEDAFAPGEDLVEKTMVTRWKSEEWPEGRWHLGAELRSGPTLWHYNSKVEDFYNYTRFPRMGGTCDMEFCSGEERVLGLLSKASLNLCEVISSAEGELRPARERRRKGGKKRRVRGKNIYDLHLPVKVDMRKHVQDYLSSDTSRVYKVRWVVRGHWRMQACGPQRSLRKKRWIEPHWKGPERGTKLVREHQLTDRKIGLEDMD